MKDCSYCKRYGVLACARQSRKYFDGYTKERLLEVIDDILLHHKGGLNHDSNFSHFLLKPIKKRNKT